MWRTGGKAFQAVEGTGKDIKCVGLLEELKGGFYGCITESEGTKGWRWGCRGEQYINNTMPFEPWWIAWILFKVQ